jgi:hypothetical protein
MPDIDFGDTVGLSKYRGRRMSQIAETTSITKKPARPRTSKRRRIKLYQSGRITVDAREKD